jgi:hypothetical protein
MTRFRFLVSIVCAVIALLAVPAHAAATRPYLASGSAQFISPTEFVGQGQATHLGRYSEAGTVVFSPTDNPAVLHVDGAIVYTAANGDELHAIVSGELNGQTGVVEATVTYVGGTGRFTSASGSSDLSGQLLAGGALSVEVEGAISY